MKTAKILLALVLALTMVMGLCACGGNDADTGNTTGENTTTQQTQAPAGSETTEPAPTETSVPETTEEAAPNADYTVKVVDEAGNPIAGLLVQLCNDTNCYPAKTDDNGVARFNLMPDSYVAKVTSLPEGYDYVDDVQEFEMGDATELTITLKAIA